MYSIYSRFVDNTTKLGTLVEMTYMMGFRYDAEKIKPFCYHGNRFCAAITGNHKFLHISGVRHAIIVNEVSTPIFSRSNIKFKTYSTVSGAYCCHGNPFDAAIGKKRKSVNVLDLRHDNMWKRCIHPYFNVKYKVSDISYCVRRILLS